MPDSDSASSDDEFEAAFPNAENDDEEISSEQPDPKRLAVDWVVLAHGVSAKGLLMQLCVRSHFSWAVRAHRKRARGVDHCESAISCA